MSRLGKNFAKYNMCMDPSENPLPLMLSVYVVQNSLKLHQPDFRLASMGSNAWEQLCDCKAVRIRYIAKRMTVLK